MTLNKRTRIHRNNGETCSQAGCYDPVKSLGRCNRHYKRFSKSQKRQLSENDISPKNERIVLYGKA